MKVKEKFFVHPTAIVEEGAVIGENTRIWHHVHVRKNAKIGKNCNLGKDVYVDVGVEIGDNVKLENRVSVFRGVRIEDDVFVGPHATFTNDLYPRAFSTDWEVVPTVVKRGASIGAGAVIVCGVTIGRYAMVAAGAVVTKDVPDFGLVMGVPGKLKGFVCYCGRPLGKPVNVNEKEAVFKCNHCGKEVRIPKDVYFKVKS